jgi:predicted NAD/FAD-dependent oxidoreductase
MLALTVCFMNLFLVTSVTSMSVKTVAVIGGGVSGLSCADRLAAAFDVTVYDTGRLRPGGRCSSRQVNDPLKKEEEDRSNSLLSRYRFDHAAQILSVPSDPLYADFSKKVQEWEKAGIIRRFPENAVYNIRSHKKLESLSGELFYGSEGMGSIPASIVKQSSGAFKLNQDVWVSPSNGVKYMPSNSKWKVQAGGKVLGFYDALVIAHNGKCADRLMSKTPAKDVHNLLRVNFAPTVPSHGGTRMTLNSVYSLTFAVPTDSVLSKRLPDSFVAGFVHNHPALRFLTCQTRKYPADGSNVELWTVLSSAAFAKKYKAPQESLPEDTVSQVSRLLLSAIEEAVTGNGNATTEDTAPCALESSVLDQRLQLWGAALPLNQWETGAGQPAGFLYDAKHSVGVCGDWLVEASLAGAWTSGYLLAEHILSCATESYGLEGSFRRSESTARVGIGSLPT